MQTVSGTPPPSLLRLMTATAYDQLGGSRLLVALEPGWFWCWRSARRPDRILATTPRTSSSSSNFKLDQQFDLAIAFEFGEPAARSFLMQDVEVPISAARSS